MTEKYVIDTNGGAPVNLVGCTVLAKDSKDNAVATATAAAGTATQRYFITGMDASYSTGATSGLLQLLDGATVIWEGYFSSALRHNFIHPIKGSLASSFSAVLTASGTAGVIGKVDIRGYLF